MTTHARTHTDMHVNIHTCTYMLFLKKEREIKEIFPVSPVSGREEMSSTLLGAALIWGPQAWSPHP